MIHSRAFSIAAAALILSSCQEAGTGPVTVADVPCESAAELHLPRFSVTPHKRVVTVAGQDTAFSGTTWAPESEVKSFFGDKEIKVVFTLKRSMFLLTYEGGKAKVTRISHDDEGVNGQVGSINSPLFSPDGKKILFAGTTRGKPGFILDAVSGNAPARRVTLEPLRAHVTADPHWFIQGDSTYIYFSTLPGLVNYSDKCRQIAGATYRMRMLNDTTLDSIRTTGIPGSYRGGLSKDGLWAGTSYASSALFNTSKDSTILLAGGEQQCNPSMNPYAIGSKHTDYMLVLAFGGKPAYKIIDGTEIEEGLHENLWIYNKDNKVVWQAKRPDENVYLRYDKPEWSTHPNFASAIVLRKDNEDGDLYIIKVGDLANAEEGKLNQAQGYLKLGQSGFTSDSYSHLWVEP
jgi:hypothetical protein